MNANNIVLTGFMGTGKTTTGIALAKKLNRTFIDTDICIEERFKMSIPEIFRVHGEKSFRNLEEEIIREVSGQQFAVISTGGGIVLNKENINHLRKKGKIYLLHGDLRTIITNLKASRSNRPLLNNSDWEKTVEELLKFRKDLYHNSADFIISIGKKTILNIADEIIELHRNIEYLE